MVRRGEVWLCALDPTVGHEIQTTRPCLVVSPNGLNRQLQTLIVAPMTRGSRPARFRAPLMFHNKDGLILTDQLRTLDRQRLKKRLGALSDDALTRALAILTDMFSIEDDQ